MPVFNNMLAGASGGAGGAGYEIERSLRFNSGDTPRLDRTPSAAGNRSTWTWSGWVKRSNIGAWKVIFSGAGSSSNDYLAFEPSDRLTLDLANSGSGRKLTTRVFRDLSAFYHIVLAVDYTSATANDRIKIYINGVLEDTFDANAAPSQNHSGNINNNTVQRISGVPTNIDYFDGYLADVHFIDGQALAPTDFGALDDNGVWQPKKFNSFNNPNNGTTWSSAVPTADGFRPGRAAADGFDGSLSTYVAINNTTFNLNVGSWNLTGAVEVYTGSNMQYAVDGGSASSMTADGWTSVGQAGSITTLTFTRSDSGYPYFYAVRVGGYVLIDSAGDNSFHLDFADNSSNAALGTDTSGNSNNFTVNNLSGGALRQYVSEGTVTGTFYTSVGGGIAKLFNGVGTNGNGAFSQTGTATFAFGGSAIVASTSLKIRAWKGDAAGANVLVNGTDVSSLLNAQSGGGYSTVDVTSTLGGAPITLANVSMVNAGGGSGSIAQIFVDDVELITGNPSDNDSLVDSPTNGTASTGGDPGGSIVGNYATLNPLSKGSSSTLANGNLEYTSIGAVSDTSSASSTIGMSSGKYYWEVTLTSSATDVGVAIAKAAPTGGGFDTNLILLYLTNGSIYALGSNTSYASGFAQNDVVNVALDVTAGKIWWGKNGTWLVNGNPATGANPSYSSGIIGNTWYADCGHGGGNVTRSLSFNFGQRAFAYAAPAGFKCLNTANLEPPTIDNPKTVFNTVLYNGDGSSDNDVDAGLPLDMVWIKNRGSATDHILADVVRGNYYVYPNGPWTEGSGRFGGFSGNTFNLSSDNDTVNTQGNSYVAWAWDAGDSNTTIAAGALNSSVYDQSQTWSNSLTSDIGFAAAATNAFDGNTSTSGSSNTGGTLTFAPNLTIPANSTIEGWFGYSSTDSGATMRVTVNGVVNNSVPGDSWRTLNYNGSTTLSSFTVFRDGSTNSAEIRGIRINGKILVDSGVSATNVPSIASTVRANPSAGFSIVSYTGNNSAGASIGHGLNTAPEFIVCKDRDSSSGWWAVYAASQGNTKGAYLNDTQAFGTQSFWNNTTPTSSVFSVGANANTNASGNGFIAYCFAPVEGYSAMGSYTGTGSQNFVYLGFKPAFIIMKSTSHAGSWQILDSSRDPYNAAHNTLNSNNSNGENSGHPDVDFVSNGFTLQADTGGWSNYSGYEYIYYAIAEHPFKTARAR